MAALKTLERQKKLVDSVIAKMAPQYPQLIFHAGFRDALGPGRIPNRLILTIFRPVVCKYCGQRELFATHMAYMDDHLQNPEYVTELFEFAIEDNRLYANKREMFVNLEPRKTFKKRYPKLVKKLHYFNPCTHCQQVT